MQEDGEDLTAVELVRIKWHLGLWADMAWGSRAGSKCTFVTNDFIELWAEEKPTFFNSTYILKGFVEDKRVAINYREFFNETIIVHLRFVMETFGLSGWLKRYAHSPRSWLAWV